LRLDPEREAAFLKVIHKAMLDAKHIQTSVPADGFLAQQLENVFALFLKQEGQTKINRIDVYNFLKFLCLNEDEQNQRVEDLYEELSRNEGFSASEELSFEDLLLVLRESNTLFELELTEKEPMGVMAAQLMV